MKNIPKQYHSAVRKLIKKAVDKREQEILSLYEKEYQKMAKNAGEKRETPTTIFHKIIKKEL